MSYPGNGLPHFSPDDPKNNRTQPDGAPQGGTKTDSGTGGEETGSSEPDERSQACEAIGRDPLSGRLQYRRIGPIGSYWHPEKDRQRWLSQLATTLHDPMGDSQTSSSRVYLDFPTRDADTNPYGFLGDVFTIGCDAHNYGEDEDGNEIKRLAIGIDKAHFHHTDDVHGTLHHMGYKPWPKASGRWFPVEMHWWDVDTKWHWRANVEIPTPSPEPGPDEGKPSGGPTTTGGGKKPKGPGPTGGRPSGTQPTGGGTGGGATTTSGGGGGQVGDNPWYGGSGATNAPLPDTDSPRPPAGSGLPGDPDDPGPSAGGNRGAGVPAKPSGGFYDPGWAGGGDDWPSGPGWGGDGNADAHMVMVEEGPVYQAPMTSPDFDRDGPSEAGPTYPQNVASGEEPNEGDGESGTRAVWQYRTPGDGFWESGFAEFIPYPDRRWPGDGFLEDPGELTAKRTSPDWTQSTLDALTRFSQDEYDQLNVTTMLTEIVERMNAIQDYLDNLNRLVRTAWVDVFTKTIPADTHEAIVTTSFPVAGTSNPVVFVSAIDRAVGDFTKTYSQNPDGTFDVTIAVTGPPASNLEVNVAMIYPVAAATLLTTAP